MGTDEEIGQYVVALPPAPAEGHERLSREKECWPRDLGDFDTEIRDRLIQRLDGREGQGKLGVDDGIDRESMHLRLSTQHVDGPIRPLRVPR